MPVAQSIRLFGAEPTASDPFGSCSRPSRGRSQLPRLRSEILAFTLIMLVNNKTPEEPFQETDFNCPLEAVMRPTMSLETNLGFKL